MFSKAKPVTAYQHYAFLKNLEINASMELVPPVAWDSRSKKGRNCFVANSVGLALI